MSVSHAQKTEEIVHEKGTCTKISSYLCMSFANKLKQIAIDVIVALAELYFS
jgi:hypothetical protein